MLAVLVTLVTMTVCAGAEEVATSAVTEAETRLGDLSGADLTFAERVPYAVQGVVTGMLMVFAVLTLLAILISLSKYVFAPAQAKKEEPVAQMSEAPAPAPQKSAPAPAPVAQGSDDELVAVLTAAVAAMLEGSEYRSEFSSGFRVVSFHRVQGSGAWNKN